MRATFASVMIVMVKGLLLAGLLGSILFAHGCHGDEDHELFGACLEWVGAK